MIRLRSKPQADLVRHYGRLADFDAELEQLAVDPGRSPALVQFELAKWIPRWPVLFWSVLSLLLRYPSVDFMPMKIEAVAPLERKRNVAATEQPVNRAVRDLQILGQVANSHEMTGSPGSVV